jgi:hypothetical protein
MVTIYTRVSSIGRPFHQNLWITLLNWPIKRFPIYTIGFIILYCTDNIYIYSQGLLPYPLCIFLLRVDLVILCLVDTVPLILFVGIVLGLEFGGNSSVRWRRACGSSTSIRSSVWILPSRLSSPIICYMRFPLLPARCSDLIGPCLFISSTTFARDSFEALLACWGVNLGISLISESTLFNWLCW